jgi:hypothetical protein
MFKQVYKSFEQYYIDLLNEIQLNIIAEPDNYIITQPTEDLVKYYLGNCLSQLELDLIKDESFEHKKYIKTIPANQREWAFQSSGDLKLECEKVILKMPILSNSDIQKIINLRTSSLSSTSDPDFIIDRNCIVFELETKGYGFNMTNEHISERILDFRANIQNYLNAKNSEISLENTKLESKLTQFINDRKEKLDSDKNRINELVKLIKIPLVRKDEEVVKRIQINKKPFVARIKPQTINEDYLLDRDKVIDIIKLINNQCLQFEKTPKTYDKLEEPNLRDLILANLNSIFEGKATGETFNNHGKTDIYLNIDKGNILVSECKFYGGEKLYHKTLDQLLGYLSWRHNFGIMITFCKQKNFTKIVEDAQGIITSHPSYNSGYVMQTNSHFITKNILPSDDYKYVEIHHLYYNLFFE